MFKSGMGALCPLFYASDWEGSCQAAMPAFVLTWANPESTQRRVTQVHMGEFATEPDARAYFLKLHPNAKILRCATLGSTRRLELQQS
jgi:hypothetical protein